jgi:acyl-CoA synthetase (AMP-forming)/AMP-acid ligase II
MTRSADMNFAEPVTSPGLRFNFAQYLIERNAGRGAKLAYVDDAGSLSYSALAERIQRLAAGLLALGVRREERVLLLMHDCTDWPVSFLGALYAGVVPVAVNTLLTVDDYAYMLQHSRAQVALVSAALLPTLQAAMGLGDHEVKTVRAKGRPAAKRSRRCSKRMRHWRRPRPPAPTIPASGSIRPAPPDGPRAPCTRRPISTGRRSCTEHAR